MSSVYHATYYNPNKKHYTYTLTYPDGRVFYVGKAGTLHRIYEHEQEVKRGKSYNSYKARVIRKIWSEGGEVLKTRLASFDTHEEACMHEIALIFFMDATEQLTNLTDGGEGIPGYTHSEKTKHKISQSHIGIGWTEETRQKRQKYIVSEETRKQQSISHLGWKPSKEITEKHVLVWLDRNHTEESKRKMSIARKGTMPEENKQQLRSLMSSPESQRRLRIGKIAKANSCAIKLPLVYIRQGTRE